MRHLILACALAVAVAGSGCATIDVTQSNIPKGTLIDFGGVEARTPEEGMTSGSYKNTFQLQKRASSDPNGLLRYAVVPNYREAFESVVASDRRAMFFKTFDIELRGAHHDVYEVRTQRGALLEIIYYSYFENAGRGFSVEFSRVQNTTVDFSDHDSQHVPQSFIDFVNSIRIKPRPNQAPEPTSRAVTPRAGARVAPACAVAHL